MNHTIGFDPNGYGRTERQERIDDRNEDIIRRWKAARTLDTLSAICDGLLEGEYLTSDILRDVRERVAALAQRDQDKIIREWEDDRAAENAE